MQAKIFLLDGSVRNVSTKIFACMQNKSSQKMQKDLAVSPFLGYSLGMETLFSAETNEALALLAKVTANFEALAIRTGQSDKALIEGLKEDKKNFDLSKKFLA